MIALHRRHPSGREERFMDNEGVDRDTLDVLAEHGAAIDEARVRGARRVAESLQIDWHAIIPLCIHCSDWYFMRF